MDYNQRWWEASRTNLFSDVFAYLKALNDKQDYTTALNLVYARLYGNYQMYGLDAYNYARVETSAASNRVTLNVIQNMIDTVVSKITKNKPRATFLTSGGDFSLQSKAKKLTKFVEGIFSYTEFYDKAAFAFLDSCIFGTGCIKIFEENGQIKTERVFINEIKIDDNEAFYSKPRQLHQEKMMNKEVLKQMFPDYAALIDQASDTYNKFATPPYGDGADLVRVIESWHLPSGEEAKDGKHTICISNATLLDEKYEKDYFPFVFFRWGLKPVGFWGRGLAEELQGIQLEMNKILRTIQVSMHLVSIPKLLVEASSKIVSAHLNNKIGGVIKYAGTPPQYAPLGGIPGELFAHLDRLYQRAYEIAGISQLAAQSLKPAGLDSGKALREFNDLETERFMATAQRYEKTFMNAAEIMIDMAKDINEREGDFKVKVKDGKFVDTIPWKDVNMDADKYMMELYPTSALSNTPAARLADVQDLLAAGFISKEDALKLLDFPDLEASMNLLNSDATNLERIIETMMDKGDYFPPEPYQNLENAIRKVQQAYLMYRTQGAAEDRLELLRQYMEDCQNLLIKAQTPSPEQKAAELAAAGAPAAAAQVVGADIAAPVGEESLIGEGALPLGEEEIVEEEEVVEEGPVSDEVMEEVMAEGATGIEAPPQ
ncbi:MAG: hypothetical protein CME31_13180 [Gimesia sp.]|nr:hypothetical protein [Gimesia sp.]